MYNKMIKALCLILVFCFFSGCSSYSNLQDLSETATENSFTIVTSFYPVYLSVINVVKDIKGVEVVNMANHQVGCLHDYTLTTNDLKTLESADAFVINGMGMEQFLEKVYSQMPSLEVIDTSSGIKPIENSNGDHGHNKNPHAWLSISNSIKQVRNIAEELSRLNPENSEHYRSNADSYIKKLEAQKEKMQKEIGLLSNKGIVTFHQAFDYFALEFGLNVEAAIISDSDSEPSAKQIEETINIIKDKNIKAIFAERQYESKVLSIIAAETGAEVYVLDTIVSGEANGDFDGYIKAMEYNLNILREAL